MSTAARALSSTARKSLIRSRLQELVREHIPEHSDFTVAEERDRIIASMDINFAHEAGMVLLTEAVHELIRAELSSRRSIFENRVTKSQKKFDEALDAWTNGDEEALDAWRTSYVIDEENTRRSVSDMTRPDLLFVANDREAKGRRHLLRAAFFRGIAERMPDDTTTVSEVMDEAQYATIYRSTFVAPAPAERRTEPAKATRTRKRT